MYRGFHMALLAEAHLRAGNPNRALATLSDALSITGTAGESWWEPELQRLRGMVLLSGGSVTEAEICFQQAMHIAQVQQAKSLELRAATSLARLWGEQGRREEARALLAPTYAWFTEGFDTTDLKDAKAILAELA